MAIIPKSNNKPKQEVQVKKDQQREFQFLGTSRKRPGQHLFGIDPETLKVYKVEIERKVDATFSGGQRATHKAIINKLHHYIWAINIENAKRKFKKYEPLFKKK